MQTKTYTSCMGHFLPVTLAANVSIYVFYFVGCLNGGGQLRTSGEETAKQRLAAVEEIYTSVRINTPYDNTLIERLYTDWLGGHDTDKVKAMLHTEYHAVEKFINALTIKW